jgi:putative two-component system response regulator
MVVHQHHEKMNGSGYPQGLKEDEILPEARILVVADVVEAMASHRPYRAALGIDAALDPAKKHLLKECHGYQGVF